MEDAVGAMIKAVVLSAVLCAVSVTPAHAGDERCRQLEDLHRQYAGVVLTVAQQVIKRKLVAWYQSHCARRASR